MAPPSTKPIVEQALPGTVLEIVAATGLSEPNIRRHLRALRNEGRAHIKKFRRTAGLSSAYWVAGPGKDAEPPAARGSAHYSRKCRKGVRNAIEKARAGQKYPDRYASHVALALADDMAARTRVNPQSWFSALLGA